MLRIKDDKSYKIKAYRRAALSIGQLDADINILYQNDQLYDIAGVGSTLKRMIEEIVETGSCKDYEDLVSEMGEGILEMLSLPGLGHKAIRTLYNELDINSVDDLKQAAEEKRIRNLSGMGSKTEDNILQSIHVFYNQNKKYTLVEIRPEADNLLGYLQSCEQVENACCVGSIRRGKTLISDIDILVSAHDEQGIRRKIKQYSDVQNIYTEKRGHIAGVLHSGVPFELIIVTPEEYYGRLVWTTGSKSHRSHLFGEFKPEDFIGAKAEEEIYHQLGLPFISPELREDNGEFEAAEEDMLPSLVSAEDLQGDLHVHSSYSDGSNNLLEIAEEAKQRGYSYVAVTDHFKSLHIVNGLDESRLGTQGNEIDKLNKQWSDFKLLKGIEVDILKNGTLDVEDRALRELDVVIASIHSYFKLDREKQTDRFIEAIKTEQVDILGHLTGRLLKKRKSNALDVERVLQEAVNYGVALEINADPVRMDIDEEFCRKAKEYGVKTSINSDAHDRDNLNNVQYGLLNARRGWLEKDDVINSKPIKELLDWLHE